MEDRPLLQTPTSAIGVRLVSVILIATISLWANYEASKGFEITIINDAGNTLAGPRFHLIFDSNDKATRIILKCSEFVERILYPDVHHPKKPIDHVTLRLANRNFTGGTTVEVDVGASPKITKIKGQDYSIPDQTIQDHQITNPTIQNTSHTQRDFVIRISPSVMDEADVNMAMASAVQRGMARVWLWDGQNGAPLSLLDGIVEYVTMVAGFGPSLGSGRVTPLESDGGCWEDKNPTVVAHFLWYCERSKHGFLARLNQAMREQWHVGMVDEALGFPAQRVCASYHSLTAQLVDTSDSTSESGSYQVI
ncbi:plant basic secretory protein (BSP) family protein [Tasmannia lanceolata]|uniref:plant basic secretory protein (BSP) family protein n=1 Tax=Tasmannia lanceolata TaxID=3420 RepID=UPI004064AF5C